MSQPRHCTTGTVTTNKEALQLYFDVLFSRSPKNPLRGAGKYGAFCDTDVIVVFPAGERPEFPLEVAPPDDHQFDEIQPDP